jgi:hypothetical protein
MPGRRLRGQVHFLFQESARSIAGRLQRGDVGAVGLGDCGLRAGQPIGRGGVVGGEFADAAVEILNAFNVGLSRREACLGQPVGDQLLREGVPSLAECLGRFPDGNPSEVQLCLRCSDGGLSGLLILACGLKRGRMCFDFTTERVNPVAQHIGGAEIFRNLRKRGVQVGGGLAERFAGGIPCVTGGCVPRLRLGPCRLCFSKIGFQAANVDAVAERGQV